MSVHPRARSARLPQRQAASAWRLRTLVCAALVLAASACAQAPPNPFTGRDPSNPTARAAPVVYRSTIAPYRSQRPVEPARLQPPAADRPTQP